MLFSHDKGHRAINDSMDGLEDVMLSEISQTKSNTIGYHLYGI